MFLKIRTHGLDAEKVSAVHAEVKRLEGKSGEELLRHHPAVVALQEELLRRCQRAGGTLHARESQYFRERIARWEQGKDSLPSWLNLPTEKDAIRAEAQRRLAAPFDPKPLVELAIRFDGVRVTESKLLGDGGKDYTLELQLGMAAVRIFATYELSTINGMNEGRRFLEGTHGNGSLGSDQLILSFNPGRAFYGALYALMGVTDEPELISLPETVTDGSKIS